MDGQTSGTTENQEAPIEIDSWEAAFAALEQKAEEGDQAASEAGLDNGLGADGDTGSAGGDGVPDQDEAVDGNAPEGDTGGLDPDAGRFGQEDGSAFAGMLNVNDKAIEEFEQSLTNDIRQRAMNDIAREFLKRDNVRSRNGQIGAFLNDPDICKYDEDGVSHYYNPETGREFTGDNPRLQAQEWVDSYNRMIGDMFNQACGQYEQHLLKEAAPKMAVMKFAPKYEKLDEIRRGMFDNVIQDYEIRDSDNNLIGYSCDLDKALDLVERQVAMIQEYAKRNAPQNDGTGQAAPSGPVLDMPTSGNVRTDDDIDVKSLADAMERLQDAELDKLRK